MFTVRYSLNMFELYIIDQLVQMALKHHGGILRPYCEDFFVAMPW